MVFNGLSTAMSYASNIAMAEIFNGTKDEMGVDKYIKWRWKEKGRALMQFSYFYNSITFNISQKIYERCS